MSGGNTVVCRPRDSENDPPASTSDRVWFSTFASILFSVCVARIDSVRSSERPAEIIVAICRAITARSLSPTFSPMPGIVMSRWRPVFVTSVMDVGASPMVRRRLTTAPSLGASMRPFTVLPLRSRTAYS